MDKQLNVWINSDLRDALAERARRDRTTLRSVVENILRLDIARERGEIMQQQAFPLLRELMQREIDTSFAQLRMNVREDLRVGLLDEIRNLIKISENRLVRLNARVARDTSVLHRFLYALVANIVDVRFAHDAYENAKERAAQELTISSTAKKPGTEG